MNTIAATPFAAAPQPLLSLTARIAAGVAVGAAISLVMLGAGQASHQAVQTAAQAFAGNVQHVKLSTVEIVGRRETGSKRT
ncbi:hypothetical protein [Caenimonas aquaedulcis]|uniref:Uncharacterized protein n=1 Tax=Caenimonas aquaedulcis TaxID=2793270 RepID=A0A931MHE4_9BURK|nr:hypothetical protein [Caenimonas aquaedulcis]MBG9388654.1 hypothetical protein [Caenimonas aquaedulcis]